jgi:Family of unknown function (DUF6069)
MSNQSKFSTILTAAATATGIATAINVILYYILVAVNVHDNTWEMQPGQTIGVAGVIMSTLMFSIVGTLVFLLINRFSSQPARIFTIVCIVGFLLSLGNPFFAGVPSKMAVGLDLMHIAPAYLLWRYLTGTVKA